MFVPFSKENAAEMQRRSRVAIAERQAATKAKLAQLNALASEDEMILRTKKQLVRLDDLIDAALDAGKAAQFMKLSATKERLWNLVNPKAGVMRPRQSGRRGGGPASLPPPVPE